MLGVHEYLRRLSGDRLAAQVRDTLTERLVEMYASVATDDWPWFEDVVAYDNAKLPHALLLSGRWSGNRRPLRSASNRSAGCATCKPRRAGVSGPSAPRLFPPRRERATYDQQPLEAHATVSACIEAYRATDDTLWLDTARWAFEWFLGRNDLGLPVYNASTGGCCDGLLEDRINENQGAESTLAMLLSLAELMLLEVSLAAREKPVETPQMPVLATPVAG